MPKTGAATHDATVVHHIRAHPHATNFWWHAGQWWSRNPHTSQWEKDRPHRRRFRLMDAIYEELASNPHTAHLAERCGMDHQQYRLLQQWAMANAMDMRHGTLPPPADFPA